MKDFKYKPQRCLLPVAFGVLHRLKQTVTVQQGPFMMLTDVLIEISQMSVFYFKICKDGSLILFSFVSFNESLAS